MLTNEKGLIDTVVCIDQTLFVYAIKYNDECMDAY